MAQGQPAFSGKGEDRTDVLRSCWLVIGPEPSQQLALIRSLARFGVLAEPGDANADPVAMGHAPVLCDARLRPVLHGLLDAVPRRLAPVLVIGANGADARARLILSGADDAVSGRTAPVELAARMAAAWRARAEALGIVRLAGLVFDTGLRQVSWQGLPLVLMPREFDLLLVLARNAGLAMARHALLHAVWQTGFDPGTNSLEVHIFKLRGRLAVLGGAVRIDTVKGLGYRLMTDQLAVVQRTRG